MKSFSLLLLIIFLAGNTNILHAQEDTIFRYQDSQGLRYRINAKVSQTVFQDWNELYKTDIVNNISAEVLDINNDLATIRSVYQIAERKDHQKSYEIIAEEATAEFQRNSQGIMSGMGTESLYPQLRDMPYLPEKPIAIGETWEHEATDVQDIKNWANKSHRLTIPFKVSYKYVGDTDFKGKKVQILSLNYAYRQEINPSLDSTLETDLNAIEAKASGRLLWDKELGQAVYFNDKFQFSFFLSDTRYDIVGHSIGELILAEDLSSETEKIEKQLDLADLDSSTNVKQTKEGIKIDLKNLLFKANSDILLPGEENKLDVLRSILEQYPERSILIRGHTYSTGSLKAEQVLSQKRAQKIGDYILENSELVPQNILTEGVGAKEMLDPTNPEVNRRVEIVILEN